MESVWLKKEDVLAQGKVEGIFITIPAIPDDRKHTGEKRRKIRRMKRLTMMKKKLMEMVIDGDRQTGEWINIVYIFLFGNVLLK